MSLLPYNQVAGTVGTLIRNGSSTQQAPVAATRTYLNGSSLVFPLGGMKIGSRFNWKFNLAKTAAGVATSALSIAVGALGTTADTDRVTFTKPAGTAVIDEAVVEVFGRVRAVGASTGVLVATFKLDHNLASTGHIQTPQSVITVVSAAFDNTADPITIGLCLTSGAADAVTIEQMNAELFAAR